ncbi:MAG: thiosulfate oxidation carrier complex protein SoxZ [Burkholderiaceae bacterium]|nr:thiosulfate oxidation carrier complex protein SoxZ [Burkholderiaceae bacterium]MBP7658665.1 thiosulfate oxidation carrier complex protein SoxZ [Burkholderiaceae bacterium]
MTQALLNLPARVRRGEIFEIRALVAHPMETGLRTGPNGGIVPRNIIEQFRCTYDGVEVFRATLHPAITANPYLAFFTRATRSGVIECTWIDDRSGHQRASASVTVE